MRYLVLCVCLAAILFGAGIGAASCTPGEGVAVKNGVKSGVNVADQDCIELRVTGQEGIVCATIEELAPLVPLILARRAAKDGGRHD